jgi:AraC family transcriptional regulator of adaptative response/methylated-DNA-[protein]-cysteine methyltransferase
VAAEFVDVLLETETIGGRNAADGWRMIAGFAASPFGRCLIAQVPRGICHLSFLEPARENADWPALGKAWPGVRMERDDAMAGQLAARIFGHGKQSRPLRVFVRGTPFQIDVWRALMNVKPGTLTTYGRLARAIGKPAAVRAVGTAVGRNPVAFLIPCHRVIRETGAWGGYRWGVDRKQAIVAWELQGKISKP